MMNPQQSSAVLHLRISSSNGVPIYLQIVNQIKYLIAASRLMPGEELPAIRTLAERLTINPNTVARAYRELELEGAVEKRRTNGTFVADGGSRLADEERRRLLIERIDALLAEARQLGVEVADVLELIQKRDALLREGELAR
jgi:GntR family transcriptional regulator